MSSDLDIVDDEAFVVDVIDEDEVVDELIVVDIQEDNTAVEQENKMTTPTAAQIQSASKARQKLRALLSQ